MNQEEEILKLKELVAAQSAEIASLKADAAETKAMIDGYADMFVSMAIDVTFAHYKVNHLLHGNPELVADFAALEAIIGPLEQPTPKAPMFS